MRNSIMVCSTYRGMSHEVDLAIKMLERNGVSNIIERETTDVSLARNVALSLTCNTMLLHPRIDTAVLIDDDMMLYDPVKDVQTLVNHSRVTGVPASGVYVNTASELCATPYLDKWKVGLGLIAIPRDCLFKLRENSFVFDLRGEPMYEFTWSGVDRESGDWQAEAYRLCQRLGESVQATTKKGIANWHSSDHRLTTRLGGVDLIPEVILGHLKKVPITPTKDEVLSLIAKVNSERNK